MLDIVDDAHQHVLHLAGGERGGKRVVVPVGVVPADAAVFHAAHLPGMLRDEVVRRIEVDLQQEIRVHVCAEALLGQALEDLGIYLRSARPPLVLAREHRLEIEFDCAKRRAPIWAMRGYHPPPKGKERLAVPGEMRSVARFLRHGELRHRVESIQRPVPFAGIERTVEVFRNERRPWRLVEIPSRASGARRDNRRADERGQEEWLCRGSS